MTRVDLPPDFWPAVGTLGGMRAHANRAKDDTDGRSLEYHVKGAAGELAVMAHADALSLGTICALYSPRGPIRDRPDVETELGLKADVKCCSGRWAYINRRVHQDGRGRIHGYIVVGFEESMGQWVSVMSQIVDYALIEATWTANEGFNRPCYRAPADTLLGPATVITDILGQCEDEARRAFEEPPQPGLGAGPFGFAELMRALATRSETLEFWNGMGVTTAREAANA